ncbi:MAG TPA: DUF4162 domain-containing protein, partial [Yinghuangia sp.]|nr:DUF4162 domain-containing protein [Yinghuangia sp.]
VGIIKDGRMHAVGTVRELRGDNRAVRYRVGVDAPAGWAHLVPGVTVLADDREGTLVELHPGTSEQGLLDAARAAGRVRAFAPVNPSLTELFREAVNGRDQPVGTAEDTVDAEDGPLLADAAGREEPRP